MSCSSFTRSEVVRHQVAVAGRGLPAIEAGMPVPAGTGLTRREMVVRGFAAGLTVYGASRLGVGALEEGIATAAVGAPGAPVLVSIFLPGGLDGLSVLAPVGDARYRTLRPQLALAEGEGGAFTEDPRLMWAPAAAGLQTLHAEGKVSVAPAIGYADADQSHFTSRHFWEVGATDASARHGWLGRYLDAHGSAENPLQGLSLAGSLSPALATAVNPVAAVDRIDDFDLWAPGVGGDVAGALFEAIGGLGRLPTTDPQRRSARAVAARLDGIRRSLGPFQAQGSTPGFLSPVPYPSTDFGRRLAGLGALLGAGLPLRAVTLDAPGGYDTHADQAATLAGDLRETCEGVLAFQRDLEARGQAGRVVVLLWSEFGRRPAENQTGTDHGAGGVGFVVGARARGTMLGEFPGLATLDSDENLRSTVDFRSIYCGLLEEHFGVDAAPLVPGAASFARMPLLR